MDRNSDKRVALVTGGSKGIGKAIAIELLKSDFSVYICSRTLEGLKKTCSELSCFGKIDSFQLDISDTEEIRKFTKEWNITLDVLVNNAGICRTEELMQKGSDVWEDTLKTNLDGLYYLTKGLIKWIPEEGNIINISSQLGVDGRAGFGAYCASKHALLGLTKCWAQELGCKKIRVNAVCPGWVKTAMAMADVKKMADKKNISEEKMYKVITKDLGLKRFIEPSEVANLVAFLISDKAKVISGQSYFIK